MSLNQWPVTERPREKLLHEGESALSNSELLAILLGHGYHTKNVVALARDLMIHYGSLQNLFHAGFESLSAHKGIGLAKYAQIKAAHALIQRYLEEPLTREPIELTSPALKNFLIAKMRAYEREVLCGLFLDTRLYMIRFEPLFLGTLDQSVVYPRELAKHALSLNAKAVIIVHNHPSGDVEPSEADIMLTNQLVQLLRGVEVHVLDHMIVAGEKTFSFAQMGYL